MTITKKQTFFAGFKIAVVLLIAFAEMCFGQSTWKLINPISQPLPDGQQFTSVVYGNGEFVVGGNYGIVLASPDGKAWTEINLTNNQSLASMVYSDSFSGGQPGMFMAVGDLSAFLTSPDGTTWTIDSTTIQYLTSVAYGKGRFIAVNNTNSFSISIDGKTWTKIYLAFNQLIYYVTYCNGQFVALDDANGIVTDLNPTPPDTSCFLTSVDGSSWSKQIINITGNINPNLPLYSIAWGKRSPDNPDSQFVGVGYEGAILISPDGAIWTPKNSGSTSWLHSVIFNNGQFVAVGSGGTILTSLDGSTWTKQISGTTNNINSVTYANGLFVAVGNNGTILTSNADPVRVAFQTNLKSNTNALKINITKSCISAMLPNTTPRSQLKVGVFNVTGKQIYSTTTGTQNGILNIPAKSFPAGKYFMSITDENNRTLNSSFVLAR